MGFVRLNNGELVHTSIFDKNPVVKLEIIKDWDENNIHYTESKITFKDGTESQQILSYIK